MELPPTVTEPPMTATKAAATAKAKATKAAPAPDHPQNSAPVIKVNTMLVTPEQALQWLGVNAEENRNVRSTRVDMYARDMRDGKWQLTGEAIKLDTDGVLIDGQHRLRAVVKANVPVYMLIVSNLPHEAMTVLDSGISRTFGDKLKGVSSTHRNQIAAVVRRVTMWERGNRMSKSDAPTHAELMSAFDRDASGFTAATLRGMDVARQRICSAGPAGTAFYLFNRIDPEQAHRFFDFLITGANLPEKHPILTVRNRLTGAQVRREDKLSVEDQLALLIRAWNAFRENRTLDRIPIAKGALTNRTFPTPV